LCILLSRSDPGNFVLLSRSDPGNFLILSFIINSSNQYFINIKSITKAFPSKKIIYESSIYIAE